MAPNTEVTFYACARKQSHHEVVTEKSVSAVCIGYGCVPYGKAIEFTYGKLYYWLSFVVSYMFPFVA